jgi:ankyrin repeat protein/tetratricopeptide (TPR) repeat protein
MLTSSAQLSKHDYESYILILENTAQPETSLEFQEAELLADLKKAKASNSPEWFLELDSRFKGQLLHNSVRRGWANLLKALLQDLDKHICRQLVDKLDDDQLTPLVYACKLGNHEAINFLLDNGASAIVSTRDSATSILNYLPNVQRDPSGNHIKLLETTRKLIRAGANPNAQPENYRKLYGLFTGDLDPIIWNQAAEFRSLPPLVFATWLGDSEAVACLLELGATPDALCLHLAASLHQSSILEKLLTWGNVSQQNMTIGKNTLLDTALHASTIFPAAARFCVTEKTPVQSMDQMLNLFLSEQFLAKADLNFAGEYTVMNICRYYVESKVSTLQKIFSILWHEEPLQQHVTEALTTAVIWNNQCLTEFLLSGRYPIDEATQAATLMRCAEYPASSRIYESLVESHGFNINLSKPSKLFTEIETPIQMAIACQNFLFANYLFERGATRDSIISSPASRLQNRTFLGWLVGIAWSESSIRLSYLFKSYLRQDPPHFIILPHIGKSVIQQVASQAPANQWNEKDVRDMMGYLVEMYPGSRHLEYQRIDEQSYGSNTKHTGYVHTIANGRSEVINNDFHFKNPIKTFTSTKEKEHNGTALHHAVRAVNFPAVEVLVQAGADASAMIGLALPDTISVTRKPASTYAVRENNWASTVLDFAVLINDRLEAGVYPSSMPDRSPSTISYFKKRSADIVNYLNQRNAAHSVTFIGKRNEERIYKERRTKGNIAAFRMFSKDLKDGISHAITIGKNASKEAYREAKEEWKDERTRGNTSQQVLDNDLAVDYQSMGRLKEAAELYEKALELNEREIGEYDSLTLLIRSNLSMVYKDLGNIPRALELARRAWQGYELMEGDKHHMTYTAANNLATILVTQGEWKEANSLYLKALEGRKRLLGPDDPVTLSTVVNLASSYSRDGNYEAADEAFNRALSGQEKVLGPEDERLLATIYNMSLHYARSGRKEEAKDRLSSVLAIREKVLGREHFRTLDTLQGLAGVIYDMEDFEQAISMYERLLQGYSDLFGCAHPSTTTVAFKLGTVYKEQGKLSEARNTLKEAVRGEEIRLGADHADTLLSVYNLACVYKDQKEYAQAEPLYLRILNVREKEHGLDDMLTRNSNYDLGTIYSSVGRLDEASMVLELALKGEEKAFGPESNSTLYTASELAKVYKRQKRYDEAESMFLRALTGREKNIGLADSVVRNAYFSIGEICQQAGRLEEAASVFKLCLKGEEQALGANHGDTIITVGRLALVYKTLKRYQESATSYLRVLAANEAKSGCESKAFLDTSYNLGLVYKKLPNYIAAEANFLVSSTGYEKLLGPDDAETLDAMDELAMVLELAGNLEGAVAMHQKVLERQQRKHGAEHPEVSSTAKKISAITQRLKTPTPSTTLQTPEGGATGVAVIQELVLDDETARLVNSLSQDLARNQSRVHWDIDNLDRVIIGDISPHVTDPEGLTALLWATHHGHTDMATRLLQVDASLDARDKGGRTALHMAAYNGNPVLVKMLLDKGASIKMQDARGSNPLHHAAATSQYDIIQTMLENVSLNTEASEIDMENKDGYTPLHIAAYKGDTMTTKLLIDKGAKLTTISGRLGGSAAHIAADHGNAHVLQLFIEAGLNLDDYSAVGMTVLHYTASKGHTKATELLLSQGANMETKCPSNDYSALFYSTINRHEDVSQMLIDHGADMYAREMNEIPMLHYLAYHGFVDGVRLLLENGIDIEHKDASEATAIFAAARCKTTDALQLLLECGADAAAKNNFGATALHYAVSPDDTQAAELLLNFGADLNAKDSKGLTPLHMAAIEGKDASARLLLGKGADVNAIDNEGNTALKIAAMKKHASVMSLLILGVSS